MKFKKSKIQVTRRRRGWLAVAVLSLCVAAARADEKRPADKTDKVGLELREYLEKFHDVINTGSDEEIKEAVDHFVPNKAQVEALFPNDSDKIWPTMSRVREKFTTGYKEFAADMRKRGKPESMETVDVRKSDSSRRFKEVLTIVPEEVPVYRVVEHYDKKSKIGMAGSSSYVKIDDQWFWFPSLESVPKLINPPPQE